jgi:predicted DNA-binding ribbon-helix-helix protein
LQKRSLVIAGHRTSVALEPAFWDALDDIAAARAMTVSALIREIDAGRPGENLSSALRLAALAWFRQARDGP